MLTKGNFGIWHNRNTGFLTYNVKNTIFYYRPVLCCAFQDPIHVWSGCLEGKLKSFDINSNQEAVIGQHDNAIRCIEYSNDVNAVCSILYSYFIM